MTTEIQALLRRWEERSRSAFPADAMLINLHIRELRELDATAAPVVVGEDVERLRELLFCAYQAMGVHDAPEVWLDALSNAAHGEPFSTDGLLPYMPDAVCDAERILSWLESHANFIVIKPTAGKKDGAVIKPTRAALTAALAGEG